MADFHGTVGIRLFVDGQPIPEASFGDYMAVRSNSLDGYDPATYHGEYLFWAVSATVGIDLVDGYAFQSASSNPSGGPGYTFDAGTSFGSPKSPTVYAGWFGYYDEHPHAEPTQCTFTIHLVTGETPGPEPDPSITKYTVRTFSDENAGWANPACAEFDEGARCTISATAKKGYRFRKWTCVNTGAESTDIAHSFPVTQDMTWLAEFEEDPAARYVVSTDHVGEGFTVPRSREYLHGESCTITATPGEGWDFVLWVCSTGEVSAEQSHTFQVTADQEWTASFVQRTSPTQPGGQKEIITSACGNGTTSPGRQVVYYGTTVAVSATAGAGSRFVVWVGPGGATVTEPSFSRTVTDNEKWTAFFVDEPTDPGGELHRVYTVVAQGKGSVSGSGLYRSGARYMVSAVTPYTAQDGTMWTFNGWRDDSGRFHSGSTVTAVMGGADITYNAYYDSGTKYRVRIAQKPSGSGVSLVSCNHNTAVTGTGDYSAGETCRLTATPSTGAKLILFYTISNGVVTRHDGGSASFPVSGDTEVYALSLFEEAKFFYDVQRIDVSGAVVDADENDIDLDKGFDKYGGLGIKHKVGEEFDVEASLKVSDKLYDMASTWLIAGLLARRAVDIEIKSSIRARCRTVGDCADLVHYYTEFTNPDPYFMNGEYVVLARYTTGMYSVKVSFMHYAVRTSRTVVFIGDVKSMTSGNNGVYACGTDARIRLTVARMGGVDQGWKFLARRVLMDGAEVASDICRDGASDTVELGTAGVEKGKTVDVVVHVWHEHDGKVLCAQSGDVVCTGDSIVSR